MIRAPQRSSPWPTDEEKLVLARLRKALRIHLVPDGRVVMPDLGDRAGTDDAFQLVLRDGFWMVLGTDGGVESATRCCFDSVADAAHYLFHIQTALAPINAQLDACDPPPC